MTIRKLAAFVPLALLVGAAVHVTVAGFDHAPGGRLAFEIFVGLVIALGLCLSAAFLAGTVGTIRPTFATTRERVYGTIALAVAGTAAFALLELVDGHFHAGGILRALATSLPLATLVVGVAGKAARLAGDAGSRFAFALRGRHAPRGSVRLPSRRRRAFAARTLAAGTLRGRAPPLFV